MRVARITDINVCINCLIILGIKARYKLRINACQLQSSRQVQL